MLKKPDIGRRKNLRIAMCALYLLQILVCTMPFIQYINAEGKLDSKSPIYLASMLIGVVKGMTAEIYLYCTLCVFVLVIPIVGFFFCALDKQRNLKNIVSLLLCFAGVYVVLAVSRQAVSLGAVVALLVYIVLMLLTTMAMVMRLSNEEEKDDNKEV